MTVFNRGSLSRRTLALAAAGLSLAGGSLLLSLPGARAGTAAPAAPIATPAAAPKPDAAPGTKYVFGDTVITAGTIDYDLEKRQYIFTEKVDLVSKNSHMTAAKMTVQMNADNEMQWAKCEGGVTVERKNPEANTSMTGRGRTLEYYEIEQKANLQGNVTVHQTSPRLARPAIITGSRIDMDLKAQKNTVYRTPEAQAKVHLEPKGNEKDPTPEPADLVGDRIDQDEKTQEYVATGNPFMVRPSNRLRAKTIRFTVEEQSNEINLARAEENVVFDGQNERGSVIHSTGDLGVYKKAENELTMSSSDPKAPKVHATVKEPDEEKPTVYQGTKFVYNTKTGRRTLYGPGAQVIIPDRPKKPQAGAGTPAAPGAAPGAPAAPKKEDAAPKKEDAAPKSGGGQGSR